ncbi:MAG: sodium:proton antiporter [Bacteroidota bacterium]
MDLFNIVAILVTLTAVFSYVNYRYIGLPVTIGVMLIALSTSLMLNLLGSFGFGLEQQAQAWLRSIDFDKTLLHGMLSFLLFAGALHIDINDLATRKWSIGSLATVGTIISTFIVGTLTWWVLGWFGVELSYIYCLLFGALISPTDPIAVLGILKTAGVPKSLEIKITGESLFNDGVGIVAFFVILEIATGTHEVSAGHIGVLLVQEALGGVLFGLGVGYLAYQMLKSVDNYQVEVLITLALVAGGYALANALHLSGPIAIVVAGLLIGNHGRLFGMSEETRLHLDVFWELIDEILNAVLFVLIGLEVLVLTFTQSYLLASLLIIPLVLLSRFIAIGIPVTLLRSFRTFSPGAVRIMTWGGLRGGISVALALSLPPGAQRDVILAITYAVVVFSILVQGLTIEKLVKRTMLRHEAEEE